VGNSRSRLEAGHQPTPVVRQGPAPDERRTGGIQPAHQRRSTDVQRSRLLPCMPAPLPPPPPSAAGRENAPTPLECGQQSGVAAPRCVAPGVSGQMWLLAEDDAMVERRLAAGSAPATGHMALTEGAARRPAAASAAVAGRLSRSAGLWPRVWSRAQPPGWWRAGTASAAGSSMPGGNIGCCAAPSAPTLRPAPRRA
jgi:hypothetical protein